MGSVTSALQEDQVMVSLPQHTGSSGAGRKASRPIIPYEPKLHCIRHLCQSQVNTQTAQTQAPAARKKPYKGVFPWKSRRQESGFTVYSEQNPHASGDREEDRQDNSPSPQDEDTQSQLTGHTADRKKDTELGWDSQQQGGYIQNLLARYTTDRWETEEEQDTQQQDGYIKNQTTECLSDRERQYSQTGTSVAHSGFSGEPLYSTDREKDTTQSVYSGGRGEDTIQSEHSAGRGEDTIQSVHSKHQVCGEREKYRTDTQLRLHSTQNSVCSDVEPVTPRKIVVVSKSDREDWEVRNHEEKAQDNKTDTSHQMQGSGSDCVGHSWSSKCDKIESMTIEEVDFSVGTHTTPDSSQPSEAGQIHDQHKKDLGSVPAAYGRSLQYQGEEEMLEDEYVTLRVTEDSPETAEYRKLLRKQAAGVVWNTGYRENAQVTDGVYKTGYRENVQPIGVVQNSGFRENAQLTSGIHKTGYRENVLPIGVVQTTGYRESGNVQRFMLKNSGKEAIHRSHVTGSVPVSYNKLDSELANHVTNNVQGTSEREEHQENLYRNHVTETSLKPNECGKGSMYSNSVRNSQRSSQAEEVSRTMQNKQSAGIREASSQLETREDDVYRGQGHFTSVDTVRDVTVFRDYYFTKDINSSNTGGSSNLVSLDERLINCSSEAVSLTDHNQLLTSTLDHSVTGGVRPVPDAVHSVDDQVQSVTDRVKTVTSGAHSVSGGIQSVTNGIHSMTGVQSVTSGIQSVTDGVWSVTSGAHSVTGARQPLTTGYCTTVFGSQNEDLPLVEEDYLYSPSWSEPPTHASLTGYNNTGPDSFSVQNPNTSAVTEPVGPLSGLHTVQYGADRNAWGYGDMKPMYGLSEYSKTPPTSVYSSEDNKRAPVRPSGHQSCVLADTVQSGGNTLADEQETDSRGNFLTDVQQGSRERNKAVDGSNDVNYLGHYSVYDSHSAWHLTDHKHLVTTSLKSSRKTHKSPRKNQVSVSPGDEGERMLAWEGVTHQRSASECGHKDNGRKSSVESVQSAKSAVHTGDQEIGVGHTGKSKSLWTV